MVARDRRHAGARHHTEGTARGLRADREVLDARATDRAVRRSAPGDASQCASRSSPSRSRARSTPCRRSTAPRSASPRRGPGARRRWQGLRLAGLEIERLRAAHDAVEEVAHVLARKRGAMIAREGASASIHSARRWRRSSRWAAARGWRGAARGELESEREDLHGGPPGGGGRVPLVREPVAREGGLERSVVAAAHDGRAFAMRGEERGGELGEIAGMCRRGASAGGCRGLCRRARPAGRDGEAVPAGVEEGVAPGEGPSDEGVHEGLRQASRLENAFISRGEWRGVMREQHDAWRASIG